MNDNRPPSQHMIDEVDPARDSWTEFQIMADLVEGFEKPAKNRPSVGMPGGCATIDAMTWT